MSNTMKKTDYHQYLQSPQWSSIRLKVLDRDGYRCRVCNSGLDLNVHHRTYDNIGNELEHLYDLTTLCRPCHALFHGKPLEPIVVSPQHKSRKKKRKGKRIPAPLPEIPPGKFIKMTPETLKLLKTPHGGYTLGTVQALGFPDMKKKWKNKIKGTTIPREQFIEAAKCRTMWATRSAAR